MIVNDYSRLTIYTPCYIQYPLTISTSSARYGSKKLKAFVLIV